MKLIFYLGELYLDKIAQAVGGIRLETIDCSKLDRTVYPYLNSENCYRLRLYLTDSSFYKQGEHITIYSSNCYRNCEQVKKKILSAMLSGEEECNIRE